MKWTLEDLRDGRVAVQYAGNYQKLSRVLAEAFPQDKAKLDILVFKGGGNYFTGHSFEKGRSFWVQTPLKPDKPIITENEIF